MSFETVLILGFLAGAAPALLMPGAVSLIGYVAIAQVVLIVVGGAYGDSLTEDTDGPGSLGFVVLLIVTGAGVVVGGVIRAALLLWKTLRRSSEKRGTDSRAQGAKGSAADFTRL